MSLFASRAFCTRSASGFGLITSRRRRSTGSPPDTCSAISDRSAAITLVRSRSASRMASPSLNRRPPLGLSGRAAAASSGNGSPHCESGSLIGTSRIFRCGLELAEIPALLGTCRKAESGYGEPENEKPARRVPAGALRRIAFRQVREFPIRVKMDCRQTRVSRYAYDQR